MKNLELYSLNRCFVLNNSVAYYDVHETETQKSVTYLTDGDETRLFDMLCVTGLLLAGNKQVKSLTVQQ